LPEWFDDYLARVAAHHSEDSIILREHRSTL
jgi:hypothetical protein